MSINSFQNIALENVDAAKTLDADSVSEQRFNNTRLYIKRFFELIRKKSPQLLLKVRSVFNRKRNKKMKRKKISVSQHSWWFIITLLCVSLSESNESAKEKNSICLTNRMLGDCVLISYFVLFLAMSSVFVRHADASQI